jgi:pimeloyl-ACP methyl ester carboxylesterase
MVTVASLLAVLVALPVLATAAIYLAAWGKRGDSGTEPLRAVETVAAFLGECAATAALLAAWPFRLHVAPVAADAGRRLVLFVPERHCASAGFWYLRRRLTAAGWTMRAAVEHRGDSAELTALLDAQLAALPTETDVVLVGHGLGGMLARAYADSHPDPRLRHVITLGTPHQGSGALPYRLPGSRDLPERAPPPARGAVDVIAICSDFDAWLLPFDAAYCPDGFNIAVRGVGHCAMLLSARIADLITENLAAPAITAHPPSCPAPGAGAGNG